LDEGEKIRPVYGNGICCCVQEDRNINRNLRNLVLGYYGYLWMQKKVQDNDDFLQLLPTITKVDYCFAASSKVFKKVYLLLVLVEGQYVVLLRLKVSTVWSMRTTESFFEGAIYAPCISEKN